MKRGTMVTWALGMRRTPKTGKVIATVPAGRRLADVRGGDKVSTSIERYAEITRDSVIVEEADGTRRLIAECYLRVE